MSYRVLVGAPVTDSLSYKNYCLSSFFQTLRELNCAGEKDVLLIIECTHGRIEDYATQLLTA